MAFIKTKPYYEHKIKTTKEAIEGTKKSMEEYIKKGCEQRVIDAHKSQIESYVKIMEKDEHSLRDLTTYWMDRDTGICQSFDDWFEQSEKEGFEFDTDDYAEVELLNGEWVFSEVLEECDTPMIIKGQGENQ